MKKLILQIFIPLVLISIAILITGSGCSGHPDPDEAKWYIDVDGDSFGKDGLPVYAIQQPVGYVDNFLDCDDSNANAHPSATEIPDNLIDEDCNGKFAYTFYIDKDGDGFGSPDPIIIEINNHTTAPNNYSWFAGDCNDNDVEVHPKADEIANNGIDDNCDGETDIVERYIDADGDGYGSQNASAAQGVFNNLDCNDADDQIHPYTKEILNDGVDSNCDGSDNT